MCVTSKFCDKLSLSWFIMFSVKTVCCFYVFSRENYFQFSCYHRLIFDLNTRQEDCSHPNSLFITQPLPCVSNYDSSAPLTHHTLLLWQCFRASLSAANTMSTLALVLLHPMSPTRRTWKHQNHLDFSDVCVIKGEDEFIKTQSFTKPTDGPSPPEISKLCVFMM